MVFLSWGANVAWGLEVAYGGLVVAESGCFAS